MSYLKSVLAGSASVAVLASGAYAGEFSVPSGDLREALNLYAKQARVELIYPVTAVEGVHTRGARGNLSSDEALAAILKGTGFGTQRTPSGAIGIVRAAPAHSDSIAELAQAAPVRAAEGVETVIVTSSKIKGDIQVIPIAITALSQEELTSKQIAGGPDLVKEVPNLTFTKTNFTGYNLEIRGIGTQAISVTTDPAVAVAFNDTPFLRNHFFEQEFYDVSQVEVLRGPQGTLYGRNATAGVVNIVSAKPTDHFEAMLSADWGNYSNRRYEGMVNIPLVGDKLMLRVAGEWTKRDGYAMNTLAGKPIDGRDLWSSRTTLRWAPADTFHADFIWEHFQENDDRIRSSKQLCHTDPGPSSLPYDNGHGQSIDVPLDYGSNNLTFSVNRGSFSQGCLPGSLYDKGNGTTDFGAYGVVNGYSLPFVQGLGFYGLFSGANPYASGSQSTNLRDIVSQGPTIYRANNDVLEFNAEWQVAPWLTFNSESGYNHDFLYSTEDLNRFETAPGIFVSTNNCNFTGGHSGGVYGDPGYVGGACNGWYSANDPTDPTASDGGQYSYLCDPQLGCSDRLILQDISQEHAWQVSQEFRFTSNLEGPFNFSVGGNYLHYETVEDFIVLSNSFTAITSEGTAGACAPYQPGITSNEECLPYGRNNPILGRGGYLPGQRPTYIDPNPLSQINGRGHNYFRSDNPYVVNSYAAFGEFYYEIAKDLKFTGGVRWTYDDKKFQLIPTQTLTLYYGYPHDNDVYKAWHEPTGRAVLTWTPKLDFTDQTMVYASYSRGYKAGGQNPPGPVLLEYGTDSNNQPVHPKDFKAEYVNAYELGTKNTALDGALVFDADGFYYDYKDYQISQIVDRTSVNLNFDATVMGAEVQATWTPLPGLKFGFNGGYEDTRVKDGQSAIDLMDRTAGHSGWVVMKPWVGQSSNCVFPDYVAAAIVAQYGNSSSQGNWGPQACGAAYFPAQGGLGIYAPPHAVGEAPGLDPVVLGFYEPSWAGANVPARNLVTGQPYYIDSNSGTTYGYPVTINGCGCTSPLTYYGFDPSTAPNSGEGFAKPLGGNQLPNAPHFTVSLSGEYTMPVSDNWAATLHSDFYWQSQSFARIWNDRPYDKIRGYSNVNLALILTSADGWQVMGYVKNVFDKTAITGDFLYSDDTGLTTNVFLTDPRLFGVRVTKQFTDAGGDDAFDLFSGGDGKSPMIWLTVGGDYSLGTAKQDPYEPENSDFVDMNGGNPVYWPNKDQFLTPENGQKWPHGSIDEEAALTFQPQDSDWQFKMGVRYGRSKHGNTSHLSQPRKVPTNFSGIPCTYILANFPTFASYCAVASHASFSDAIGSSSEKHVMLDFTVGKKFGIGIRGHEGTGTLAAGVRFAEFNSRNGFNFNVLPNYVLGNFTPRDIYEAQTDEKHGFHGFGPELTWDASNVVWGDVMTAGSINVDWGANAALLFGKQTVTLARSHMFHCHWVGSGGGAPGACPNNPPPRGTDYLATKDDYTITRTNDVTVPNVGAHIGLSYNYQNAKISAGYKVDAFFNAVDGGQESVDKFDRMFYGPYLNVSIGFGG